MRLPNRPARTRERRATILAGLILVQAIAALFFIGDVIEDFSAAWQLGDPHLVLESVAALALLAGVVFLTVELRSLLSRMSDMQTGLDLARGRMAEVIETFFDEWKLTGAERDVAIMILKGLDNDSIARIRNTAAGTVRAQAARVYGKSGTEGRAQFVSLFVEELMAGDFSQDDFNDTPARGAPCAPAPKAPPSPQDRT